MGKDENIKLWFSEILLCTHHFFMLVSLYALLYIISTEQCYRRRTGKKKSPKLTNVMYLTFLTIWCCLPHTVRQSAWFLFDAVKLDVYQESYTFVPIPAYENYTCYCKYIIIKHYMYQWNMNTKIKGRCYFYEVQQLETIKMGKLWKESVLKKIRWKSTQTQKDSPLWLLWKCF